MTTKELQTHFYNLSVNKAVDWLREIETRQTTLLNGNFSMAAKKYRVKVSDIRTRYNELKNL